MDSRKKAYISFAASELAACLANDLIRMVQEFVYAKDPDYQLWVVASRCVPTPKHVKRLLTCSCDLIPLLSDSAVKALMSHTIIANENIASVFCRRHPQLIRFICPGQPPSVWGIALQGNPMLVDRCPHILTREQYRSLVDTEPQCVTRIPKATRGLWRRAIRKEPHLVSALPFDDQVVIREAVQRAPTLVGYIRHQLSSDIYQLAVETDGLVLRSVPTRHTTLCLAAVQSNGLALQYITGDVQTDAICRAALQSNGLALQYVARQTRELCLVAVRQNGEALAYVSHPTDELCREAVRQTGRALSLCKSRPQSLIRLAIPTYGFALLFLNKQTPQLCAAAVANNGEALQFVRTQTDDLCWLAVRQNPCAYRFVHQPTDEMSRYVAHESPTALLGYRALERFMDVALQANPAIILQIPNPERYYEYAVSQCPLLIKWLPQTPALCRVALENTPKLKEQDQKYIIECVIDKTEEMCLLAVHHSAGALELVPQQTHELCLAAVRRWPSAIAAVADRYLTRAVCLTSIASHAW
jgi:hypothetical protein